MKKADPLVSEGARLERAAIRRYLRRQINSIDIGMDGIVDRSAFELALKWVLARQDRYDKKKGGLGK